MWGSIAIPSIFYCHLRCLDGEGVDKDWFFPHSSETGQCENKIALIVVGVELSTEILMSLYALAISTGLFIILFETFQLAAFAFDIILYVRRQMGKEHTQFRRHKIEQQEQKAKRTALSQQMTTRLS